MPEPWVKESWKSAFCVLSLAYFTLFWQLFEFAVKQNNRVNNFTFKSHESLLVIQTIMFCCCIYGIQIYLINVIYSDFLNANERKPEYQVKIIDILSQLEIKERFDLPYKRVNSPPLSLCHWPPPPLSSHYTVHNWVFVWL